ncbi:site-specific DNA-methyltransferase [Saccharomonospora sp. NB11]|uniref:DNA-methyltransferase n=1 Tax=Saccharomonospora sp. NB11 TaxID=1642298 RepID=UPI0018D06E35|nr:site-specific DNA-methyltransferase [Saccharomonospora sp. NB11]
MTELTADRCELATERGSYYWGDSLELMPTIPDSTVDVVICSPPFEGARDIGDADRCGQPFLDWFEPFFAQFERLLRPTGCVAFELGGLWLSDAPGKAVQHAAAIRHLTESGWRLLQDFYYYNPQLLRPEPGGARRVADSVTPIWVMSRTYDVHYDVDVLQRPPHRDFVRGNLLEFDSSGPDDQAYEKALAEVAEPYIDRWPSAVPALFVELLTEPGALVLDPFAGTGATCKAADRLGRRWIGIERDERLRAHVRAMFASEPDTAGGR